jgi:hypothetical protein
MSFFYFDWLWEDDLGLTSIVKVLQIWELGKHKFGPLALRPNIEVEVDLNNFRRFDINFDTQEGCPNYNCQLTRVRFYNLRRRLTCETLLYTLK